MGPWLLELKPLFGTSKCREPITQWRAFKLQKNGVLGHTVAKTIKLYTFVYACRGDSIGKASRNGLDVTGIETRWGPDFPHTSRQALAASCKLSTGFISRE